MKNAVLLFFLFLLATQFGQSQSGTIYGRVVEADSLSPVLFGAVALFQDGVMRKGCETDFEGDYQFIALAEGYYSIEASYLGFKKTRIDSIFLGADQMIQLDIMMEQEVITFDPVIVKSYRTPKVEVRSTYSISTVNSDQIRSLPTRNINALAARTAGISSADDNHVQIRGSRTGATRYYIDGVGVVSSNTNTTVHQSVERASGNEFGHRQENTFLAAGNQAFSTFSIDVDRAAYSIVRSYLQRGQLPPAVAVRTEEMVNYFEYDYLQPDDGHPFAVHSEIAVCPWAAEHLLLSVALQGERKDLEELPLSNLTFLIDVSGSMGSPNKLPLVKQSILFLLERLRPEDQVAFVVYAGAAGVVLPPTKVSQKEDILTALRDLSAGGSTAGGQGIRLAYELAREYFIEGGNNRVILATDGDFNVGIRNPNQLEALIEEEKESGVFLTTLGFGYGNLKDNRLERLADKGNGMYAHIDTPEEARKIFGEELTGSLYTIAKDVKLQLEFNSEMVESYRLVGYENRLLDKEDFDDDAKDAGEIGAGHSVTALYEIVPKNQDQNKVDIGRLELRYKHPEESQSQLLVHELTNEVRSFEAMSCNFRWASAITAYSLILQNSAYVGKADLDLVQQLAEGAIGDDPYGIRAAFLNQLPLTTDIFAKASQP